MKLSEHFDSSEFACKCGCGGLNNGADISANLVAVLERMRQRCGKPIIITSAYRCPTHNANEGGVSNSQHVLGTAADLLVPKGMTKSAFIDLAAQCGADGIGSYPWGIHIDVRGEKARW